LRKPKDAFVFAQIAEPLVSIDAKYRFGGTVPLAPPTKHNDSKGCNRGPVANPAGHVFRYLRTVR
jgi:hypothetical protein